MFIVKIHRTMYGESREFVNDIYGPFAEWSAASQWADDYCALWREQCATASIDMLYAPDGSISVWARQREANDEPRYRKPRLNDGPARLATMLPHVGDRDIDNGSATAEERDGWR